MAMAHASSTDRMPGKEVLTAERVSVLLPLPLAGAYDYRADPALALRRGDFVVVPLGNRDVIGVVWGEGAGDVAEAKLRDVVGRLDAPALPDVVCQFVAWVANYTLSPPGAVLRMAMSVSAALEPPRPIVAWRVAENVDIRLTPERKRVLAVLQDGPPRPTVELAREAGVGTGVVKALAAAGALVSVELPPPPAFEIPDAERQGPTLSAPQA
jgi:primosomal protein N' (replication factor Y)